MTHLSAADRTMDAAGARTDEPCVLELADNREQSAPAETIFEIAAWVNEGGAAGEVRR